MQLSTYHLICICTCTWPHPTLRAVRCNLVQTNASNQNRFPILFGKSVVHVAVTPFNPKLDPTDNTKSCSQNIRRTCSHASSDAGSAQLESLRIQDLLLDGFGGHRLLARMNLLDAISAGNNVQEERHLVGVDGLEGLAIPSRLSSA